MIRQELEVVWNTPMDSHSFAMDRFIILERTINLERIYRDLINQGRPYRITYDEISGEFGRHSYFQDLIMLNNCRNAAYSDLESLDLKDLADHMINLFKKRADA